MGKIKKFIHSKTEQTSGKKRRIFLPVAKSVPEMVTRSSGVAAKFSL